MNNSKRPRLTIRYGATAWGVSIAEGDKSTDFDFSKMTRGERSKVRRMTVSALAKIGLIHERRSAHV